MSHDERRAQALERTTDSLTLELLEKLPRMISHPAPSGSEEICYQDRDLGGAIACSQSDIKILNLLGSFVQGGNCMEVGSYVGWSSAALMLHNAKMYLHCIDPFIEGVGHLLDQTDNRVMDRFLENMETLGLKNWHLYVNRIPEEIETVIQDSEISEWDFVFLDGWHLDGQPQRDVECLLPYLKQSAVVCLHDVWMPDVFTAARSMVLTGWKMQVFPTANAIAVLWREQPSWWNKFMKQVQA